MQWQIAVCLTLAGFRTATCAERASIAIVPGCRKIDHDGHHGLRGPCSGTSFNSNYPLYYIFFISFFCIHYLSLVILVPTLNFDRLRSILVATLVTCRTCGLPYLFSASRCGLGAFAVFFCVALVSGARGSCSRWGVFALAFSARSVPSVPRFAFSCPSRPASGAALVAGVRAVSRRRFSLVVLSGSAAGLRPGWLSFFVLAFLLLCSCGGLSLVFASRCAPLLVAPVGRVLPCSCVCAPSVLLFGLRLRPPALFVRSAPLPSRSLSLLCVVLFCLAVLCVVLGCAALRFLLLPALSRRCSGFVCCQAGGVAVSAAALVRLRFVSALSLAYFFSCGSCRSCLLLRVSFSVVSSFVLLFAAWALFLPCLCLRCSSSSLLLSPLRLVRSLFLLCSSFSSSLSSSSSSFCTFPCCSCCSSCFLSFSPSLHCRCTLPPRAASRHPPAFFLVVLPARFFLPCGALLFLFSLSLCSPLRLLLLSFFLLRCCLLPHSPSSPSLLSLLFFSPLPPFSPLFLPFPPFSLFPLSLSSSFSPPPPPPLS